MLTEQVSRPPLDRVELNTLWVMEFGDDPPRVIRPPCLTLRLATIADWGRLSQAMQLPSDDLVRDRFAKGRLCHVAEIADRIVSYCWVSLGAERIGELERDIQLEPSEAYIWDCATLPAYRGRGYYPALLRHILRELYDDGVRRVWIGARLSNRASQRGFEKAGFVRVATVLYVRLLGLRWLRILPADNLPARLVAAATRAIG